MILQPPSAAPSRRHTPLPFLGLVTLGVSLAFSLCGCSQEPAPLVPPTPIVTPIDLSTAGSIEVEVRIGGRIPEPAKIDMSLFPGCASQYPDPPLDDSLIIADGHLANAVVSIEEGFGDRAFAVPSEPVIINQSACRYVPRVSVAMVGQRVQFRNRDPEAHVVRGSARLARTTPVPDQMLSGSHTVIFDRAETAIPLRCDTHPWMRGYVSVVTNPYAAVTSPGGTVVLQPVPPGEYLLSVWHEIAGTKERIVTVEPRTAAKVTFEYTLN